MSTMTTVVARYTFEEQASKAALARTIETGVTHYFREDEETFIVYTETDEA